MKKIILKLFLFDIRSASVGAARRTDASGVDGDQSGRFLDVRLRFDQNHATAGSCRRRSESGSALLLAEKRRPGGRWG